jgi:hypothetical protein
VTRLLAVGVLGFVGFMSAGPAHGAGVTMPQLSAQ